jgi:hypothetical protein
VMGHTHPLDGQEIDFGEHGIERDQVPSPWRCWTVRLSRLRLIWIGPIKSAVAQDRN